MLAGGPASWHSSGGRFLLRQARDQGTNLLIPKLLPVAVRDCSKRLVQCLFFLKNELVIWVKNSPPTPFFNFILQIVIAFLHKKGKLVRREIHLHHFCTAEEDAWCHGQTGLSNLVAWDRLSPFVVRQSRPCSGQTGVSGQSQISLAETA